MSVDAPYELIYWPGIPGRGEHIRLAFEESSTLYTDSATIDPAAAVAAVTSQTATTNLGTPPSNPPPFAPPILRHGDLLISQTSNILLYLAPRLGLAGSGGETGMYHINELVLTALDGLSNEVHDVHHPIASSLYYEDQKTESARKAKLFREERLPQWLGYFERVLQGNAERVGDGAGWLYGGTLTVADLVLFQCIDGTKFAFPNAMKKLEASGKYGRVFALHKAVAERPSIKSYLGSERRQKYSMGIYRQYPELDDA